MRRRAAAGPFGRKSRYPPTQPPHPFGGPLRGGKPRSLLRGNRRPRGGGGDGAGSLGGPGVRLPGRGAVSARAAQAGPGGTVHKPGGTVLQQRNNYTNDDDNDHANLVIIPMMMIMIE